MTAVYMDRITFTVFVSDFRVCLQKKTGIFLHVKKKTDISDKTVLIDNVLRVSRFPE